MSLLAIAEILAGETLVSPGGCVDADTAAGHEYVVWERPEPAFDLTDTAAEEQAQEALVPA